MTVLLTVVLFTGCLIPHAANNETAQETGGIPDPLISTTSNIDALPELSTDSTLLSDPESLAEAEAAYRERMQRECAEGILADSKIADYVNTDEFFETKPMFRLTALETLNSYVVQNADNTNTIYFMSENVKYVDAKGEIREKDVRLSATEKGFAVTDSDVKLLLPAKISDGISVNTGFGSITLAPLFLGDSTVILDEKSNSVRYDGAFGNGTFLRYTPTLSGVKEDIVLDVRPESNSFEFMLKANDLTLYMEDGIYYLVSTDNEDCRIRFDQIFIYDANGRFTAGKTDIVDAGNGRYTLTVTAPREFLDAAETTYPVTIDPNINVYTNQYSSNIIDAAVHQNKPNMNAGTWQYDNIGYTDSTYGLARTVIKLSALLSDSTYQSLTASQINSVTFSAMEATGNSSKTVKLHPITGTPTWTESTVTWNNYGSFDTTVNYGGTLTGDVWTHFNITNLVKAWKNGSYNGNGCFIFIMGGTENSSSRALYSTEYSGTGNRPYLSMTYEAVVTFDAYSVYVNEGSSVFLECSVNPEDTYIYNWNISNTNIASCTTLNYDITNIAGYHAGNTNVTVTVRDLSNNLVGSASAMVFVLIPDDIYEIGNVQYNGSVRLTTEKILSDELSIFACSINYLSNNFPVTDQITQMWRIKHVVYNIYTIRPYYKLDMRLGKGNNNEAIAHNIGIEDTYNSQYSAYFWWITSDTDDIYKIKCDGTNKVLYVGDMNNQTGSVSVQNDNNSLDNSGRWNLEPVSVAPIGIYLYDKETDSIVTNSTMKFIAPEETRTLEDIGVIPVAYSSDVINQSFVWYSGVIADATVTSTGTVTGIRSTGNGYVGIFARWACPEHSEITSRYWMTVLEIPNGVYTFHNKHTNTVISSYDYLCYNNSNLRHFYFNCDDDVFQRWTVTHLKDGSYSIMISYSNTNYYLGILNDISGQGGQVVLRNVSSLTSGMKWIIKKNSNKTYRLYPVADSTCSTVLYADYEWYVSQSIYVDDSNHRDEWNILLNEWNSNTNTVALWEHDPKICMINLVNNDLFYFESGMECALDQWEAALDVSIASATSSEADIKVYGGTYYDLHNLFSGFNDNHIAGKTVQKYGPNCLDCIDFDGTSKYVYAMKSANVYIRFNYYSFDEELNTCCHEFGHAMGITGHSSNGGDVMYPSQHNIYTLSSKDIGQLKLYYYVYRGIY